MNNKKIEKNGIITFKYNIYDKNGNWLAQGGPVTMVVGSDTILPGLSNALLGLDYTIRNQTIDFKFFKNKNDPNFELVDLDLEIFSYNDHENVEVYENEQIPNPQINNNQEFDSSDFMKNNHNNMNNNINNNVGTNSNKENKNLKKEIIELKKENGNLKIKINELNKNEQLLNKKIIDISEIAQKQITEFKESYKQRYNEKIKEVKDFQLQGFFEKFLGPMNNLYKAVEFGVKSSENQELVGYVKGFELLINQMFVVMDQYGISIIEPKIGDEFDPSLHNIVKLDKSNEFKKDKILELLNRGYKLNGRVILPANVIVSTK